MHLKRWVSALAILPLLFWVILKGGIAFCIFIGIVALISLWEYYRIVFNNSQKSIFGLINIIGLFAAPLIIFAAHSKQFYLISWIITSNLLLVGLISIFLFKNNPSVLEDVTKQVLGIVYVPLLLTNIILIRDGLDGAIWIFFLLFIVFFGDIGAFYAGSYLGKHKLCPSISPGKTIEGALGGLFATIFIGLIFRFFLLPDLSLGYSILFFICVGIIGPFGDLFESILKRVGGIKDSGFIMPGHGGLLDRIDAVLFALPVAYFFKEYIL
jgi:phosphatidate cytidylyltransferase